MIFDKTLLQEGSGLYCPNKLAKVVVDVTGKWSTSDESEAVFDHRENASIDLGELYLEFSVLHCINHPIPQTRLMMSWVRLLRT